MAGEIFKLVGRIAMEGQDKVTKGLDNVESKLQTAQAKFESAGKKLQAAGDKMIEVGGKLTAGVTAPLTAVGTAGLVVATNFESATSKMRAALGVTEAQARDFAKVGQEVLKNGWGENLEDVTNSIIAVKTQLSNIPDDQLQNVTQKAIMLEQTFGMDMNESLRGVNALMAVYGTTADEAFDYMVVGAQNGLDKTGELGDNLAEYATLFNENGYSAEEMFNILQRGLDAGAYNLDKVNDLVKEFGVRVGDGTIRAAVDEMGGSVKQMYDEWEAGGGTNKELFQMLATELGNIQDETERATFLTEIFGSLGEDAGYNVVSAMGDVANELNGVKTVYSDVTGASDEAANAQDNFAAKLSGLKNTALQSLQPIGDILMNIGSEIIDRLVPAIESAAEWFANLSPETQTFAVAVAAVAAAVGPVLVGLGMVTKLLGTMSDGFGVVSGAVGKMAGVISGAMGAISAPILIVIGVIAALVAGFVVAYNHSEEFRDRVNAAIRGIKDAVEPIVTQIRDFVVGAFQSIKDWWDEDGQMILQAATTVFETIKDVITEVMMFILPIVETAIQGMIAAFQLFIDIALPIVQFFIDTIMNIISIFAAAINGDWQAVWDGIMNIFDSFKETFLGIFETLWNTDLIQIIVTFVSDVLTAIGQWITDMIDAVTTFFSDLWTNFSEGFLSLLEAFQQWFDDTFSGVIEWIANILENIASFFVTLLEYFVAGFFTIIVALGTFVSDFIAGIVQWIADVTEPIRTFIADIIGKIATFFSDIIGKVVAFVSDFVGKWAGMIADVTGKVASFVSDIIGKIASFVSDFVGKIGQLASDVGAKFGEMVSNVWGKITGWVSDITGKISEMAGNVIGKVVEIKDGIVNRFSEALNSAKRTFEDIKTAVTRPIEKARDLIKGIVDKIKGFFKFTVSLPRIKLPHFSIKPSGWSIGDLLKGKIPSLGIKWYANGGVFDSPSVIGVGEQRGVSEAVIPLREDVYSKMGAGIMRAMGGQGVGGKSDVYVKVYASIDGEEVATVVEPIVSEIQGDKSDTDAVRGGTRL